MKPEVRAQSNTVADSVFFGGEMLENIRVDSWGSIPHLRMPSHYDLTDRQNEQMWQTICYVVLRSIGVNVNGEVKTHDGRIDMVVDLPEDIYIVEFKLDRPAAEAMEQIRGKDYAGKYALSGKRLTLVGISFSSEKRTIVEELVEEP